MLKGQTVVFFIVVTTIVIATFVWLSYGSAQVTTLIGLFGLILAIIRYMRPSFASSGENPHTFKVKGYKDSLIDDDDDDIM